MPRHNLWEGRKPGWIAALEDWVPTPLVYMSICTRTGSPSEVVENDQVEILLLFQIHTGKQVMVNQSGIVVVNTEQRRARWQSDIIATLDAGETPAAHRPVEEAVGCEVIPVVIRNWDTFGIYPTFYNCYIWLFGFVKEKQQISNKCGCRI